ncbi:MAG: sn-glycerol-3-phosphate ABC transporter ATP-binding protein UgpC [Gaiellaceae bacterium MAG52_C11]|nr:sn-glycerol-3-phosphate ABC transporter ATP-binding protein UgpC [Candidatus Gaiellasilicea maunaloa]
MSRIVLEAVTKVYAGYVRAVDDVSLTIGSGEFMVLVGPSGCGKSTLLRMIAGLEEVSEGEIWIGEREVSRLAPRDRDIAMVFQNYALYPHMTVEKNLGYGLKVRGTPKPEIARRVDEVAAMLGLVDLRDRRPGALSGGQRQRVAMGRAIVREPAAFLMDEPLSNLDAKLRVDMRAELARLHERLGITTVYVTHDQVEAMTLGTRVAVMRDGTVQQVDSPQTLYREPANLFVAAFIGSPSMNLVEAEVSDGAVEFAGFRVPLTPERRPAGLSSGTVILGIRPQGFSDARAGEGNLPTLEIEAAVVEELGSATHVLFTIEAPPVDVESVRAASDDGERATLLATDRRTLFTAEVAEGTEVRPGDRFPLALDPARLHFFDPATGVSLGSGALAATA